MKKIKGLLIVPYFKEYAEKYPTFYTEELKSLAEKIVKEEDFKGKSLEKYFFTVDSEKLPSKLVFIGCGKKEKFDSKDARIIGAEINNQARNYKQKSVSVLLTPELDVYAEELAEGLLLKNYRVSKYKTGEDSKAEDKKEVTNVTFITNKEDKVKKDIRKGLVIGESVNLTKDLVNGPANIVDANYFQEVAKELKRDFGYSLKIYDIDKLRKLKWGGLLAINQGAKRPAKCIIIEHKGGKFSDKPIVLVGKGVIFDSGGYNLKPTRSIEDMHSDKAGASAVLGVFTALKALKIKQNVIGVLPLTENLIDGKAVRPSDIITMLSGQTVEISNTDAEGRVILADALTYGATRKPKYMIDIATLTGAAMIALGDRYTAVFSNEKELSNRLIEASNETGDTFWELPLHKEHKEKMKSKVADLRNADNGTSYLAGASKGAAFLSFFIKDRKWAHLDIGGTAYTKNPRKYEQTGATGAGVRTLIKFLEEL